MFFSGPVPACIIPVMLTCCWLFRTDLFEVVQVLLTLLQNGQWSALKGRERAVINQTNVGIVSKATLGNLLKNGAERIWAFPSAEMPP